MKRTVTIFVAVLLFIGNALVLSLLWKRLGERQQQLVQVQFNEGSEKLRLLTQERARFLNALLLGIHSGIESSSQVNQNEFVNIVSRFAMLESLPYVQDISFVIHWTTPTVDREKMLQQLKPFLFPQFQLKLNQKTEERSCVSLFSTQISAETQLGSDVCEDKNVSQALDSAHTSRAITLGKSILVNPNDQSAKSPQSLFFAKNAQVTLNSKTIPPLAFRGWLTARIAVDIFFKTLIKECNMQNMEVNVYEQGSPADALPGTAPGEALVYSHMPEDLPPEALKSPKMKSQPLLQSKFEVAIADKNWLFLVGL